MPKGYFKGTTTPIFQTHGMSNDRFWVIYQSMKHRCLDKNSSEFKRYGGRGIKLLWDSFENFKNDMYESYLEHCKQFGVKNTSINRINNDGDYCKENCNWSTTREQANNRRSNHYLEFNGQKKSMADWARDLKMGYMLIKKRIIRGWSVEKTLTTKRNSKFCNKLTQLQ